MTSISYAPRDMTPAQNAAYAHLRNAYIGPESGPEEVLRADPSLQYAVGMLFPQDAVVSDAPTSADVEAGDVEDESTLAEEWRPSSAAISFVTDATELLISVAFGAYTPVQGQDTGKPEWKRKPIELDDIRLTSDDPSPAVKSAAGLELEIGALWRPFKGRKLVTVHVRNLQSAVGGPHPTPEDRVKNARNTIYQLDFAVETLDGAVHDYDVDSRYMTDMESRELQMRFRHRRTFAVGHGLAARWDAVPVGEECRRVWLDAVPAHVVRSVAGAEIPEDDPASGALSIDALGRLDTDAGSALQSMSAFVDRYERWVREERERIADIPEKYQDVAHRVVERQERAVQRMREGVSVLHRDGQAGHVRRSFALAMRAMALQMRQIRQARGDDSPTPPKWRPFQVGFLLTALASTIDERHPDRDLVDLIWFPTGGGKTEAYLGLAAIEMLLRRFRHGSRGAGTAVITRYTLRLLTSQQFQRAATLICALEVLRKSDASAEGVAPFTIGLWVGNEVTPGTRKDANAARKRLLTAAVPAEANSFQLTDCPWCLTPILPSSRTDDEMQYGVAESNGYTILRCVDPECAFHDRLPVLVVDEDIFDEPPTFILGTVDKFAQLQFKPQAGRILGLNTSFRQPSLLIQDELHLLSGPLGTTVGAFEAGLHLLLEQDGIKPKLIASTATIRASDDQINGLYGRKVALYPPAGLDDDASYFSREVKDKPGRLYIGLMPQSLPQATALVAASAPLFEIPQATEGKTSGPDAYWTSVLYHNSLRELGRTTTLLTDDVVARLRARSQRLGLEIREFRNDDVIELTSRRTSVELRGDLGRLERRRGQSGAADAVLSSNMLSVGIDVSRLALMMMVGQPKTTSEYIQATSRVGRGPVKGIVVTLFRPNRARDRSHFETFQSFHEALYRAVEPTSVTPWSESSRKRSLPGVLVMLARQTIKALAENDQAGALVTDQRAENAVRALARELLERIESSDPHESRRAETHLNDIIGHWKSMANAAPENTLSYVGAMHQRKDAPDTLFRDVAVKGQGWVVARSMRSVEPTTAVAVVEPLVKEEAG
ncbi:helicase-related protein [Micrococcus sp.]|uniref:helicase-related protein n=1 Tax=Micrococcus sp. TaxID=1271 RepID=UPI0026DB822E|nr:helicase-related protein [Micrococcus sp.]MDO4239352.1 helicase-related protein [Micrococcus sp.]